MGLTAGSTAAVAFEPAGTGLSTHARVYRWEVEDPEEFKDELETAAASCDHLVAMGSEELDMMRLPNCLPTMTGSQTESPPQSASLRAPNSATAAVGQGPLYLRGPAPGRGRDLGHHLRFQTADPGRRGRTGCEYEVIQRPRARLRSRCLAGAG